MQDRAIQLTVEKTNTQIGKLNAAIEPFRQQIINHKVYPVIKGIRELHIFMQYHIYAVWDFMSLLKALQNNLTCTSVPWYPKGDAATRYLINEIVLGEESDTDLLGNRKSHFEMYLEAMQQCGAVTSPIEAFVRVLQETGDFSLAFKIAGTPAPARDFVDFTFKMIDSGQDYLQSAVFTFGREDLIPGMFMAIVNDLDKNCPDDISFFRYYLERHIEVDGGHHSQLALQMTASLCGNNEQYWKEATEAVVESLKKRIALWDGVYRQIMEERIAAV